jgi:hypothetical protein
MDTQAALARLFDAQSQRDTAQHHAAKASEIADAIKKSLESSGLVAQLRI